MKWGKNEDLWGLEFCPNINSYISSLFGNLWT